ncbi:MAG: hypothetical protein ACOYW7_07450 [Nitrospirota bacterium]
MPCPIDLFASRGHSFLKITGIKNAGDKKRGIKYRLLSAAFPLAAVLSMVTSGIQLAKLIKKFSKGGKI